MQRVIAAYAYYVMAHNRLHRRYLTLQQAVEEVANPPESDEEDIVILSPEQGDFYATDVEEEDEDVMLYTWAQTSATLSPPKW